MSTLKRLIIFILYICLSACSSTPGTPTAISTSLTPPISNPQNGTTQEGPGPTATPLPLALIVNGDAITLDEFNAELARYQASQVALGNHLTDQQAAAPVIDAFVSELLLAQGAQEAGFTLDDAALQTRIDALATKLGGAEKLSAWQQAHGYSAESFGGALKRQAAAAWMRDKIVSDVPSTAEQVHVRQILLYNQDSANNYYSQLEAGADFDTLAAEVEFAHLGKSVTGGDIGWIPRGYLAEKPIEDAAFALEPNQYSIVIGDNVGFHILKLIERQANRALSPDQILTVQNRALDEWVANRRQQSNVVLAPK